jgi:hypothetical protein
MKRYEIYTSCIPDVKHYLNLSNTQQLFFVSSLLSFPEKSSQRNHADCALRTDMAAERTARAPFGIDIHHRVIEGDGLISAIPA